MRTFLPIALCLAILPATSTAQGNLRQGRPAEVGMDEERLVAATHLLEEAIEKEEVVGFVWLVARRGVIVSQGALGLSRADVPMREDHLFRMASNTKPVVAAGVLALASEGVLDLDDPVARFLPSYDTTRGRAITVRQLLSHTSGLRIRPIFLWPLLQRSDQNPDAPSLRAEVRRFGAIGARVLPGTTYDYSNPGYNTLGALIEVLSGQPLESFLASRFYEPLGMRDTCHHESVADASRLGWVHRKRNGKWSVSWRPEDGPDYPFVRASGGMITTARDYAAFLQLFLDGGRFGERELLPAAWVAEATKPQTTNLFPTQEGPQQDFYGLGWSVDRRGRFSHGGSDGTWAWVDPQRSLIGVLLTQSTGGEDPRYTFRAAVEAACVTD